MSDYSGQLYQSIVAFGGVACAIGFMYLLPRKQSYAVCMGVTCVACVVQAVLQRPEWNAHVWRRMTTVAFQYIGRGISFSCLVIMYIFTPECFPTKIRGQAVGIVAAFTRIGCVISPIVVVGLIQQGQTFATFTFLSAFAGISTILINFNPIESKNRNLHDLHQDVDDQLAQPTIPQEKKQALKDTQESDTIPAAIQN